MRDGATQRLTGAVILVSLVVIFVPMLFEPPSIDAGAPDQGAIPPAPAMTPELKTETFLGPADSGVGNLDDDALTDSQPLALPPMGDMEAAAPGSGAMPAREATAPDAVAADATPPKPTSSTTDSPPPVPPRGAADGMPSWVVQVASVTSEEGAAQIEAKLRASGFSAFVQAADVKGRRYFRVRVGPEVDRANAERTAARLRKEHKLDTLISSYP